MNSRKKEIQKCNEKIMELSKQSHILSGVVAKGYLDSAIFIEKQTALQIEPGVMQKRGKPCRMAADLKMKSITPMGFRM